MYSRNKHSVNWCLCYYSFEFGNNSVTDACSISLGLTFCRTRLLKNAFKVSYGHFCDFHRVQKNLSNFTIIFWKKIDPA